MKQVTTLKKIAQSLNLSISTVSRALQNNPSIAIATRQRVLELAKVLEYEPNDLAIQLRTNKRKLFGLIVPSISGYFYNSFIASVEHECNLSGFSLLVLQSDEKNDTLLNNLNTCRKNRVNGIFVCTDFLDDLQEFYKLKEQHIPVIFFDKIPDTDAFHKVCLEDEKAAALAASYLIKKNKKNILALFGNKNLSITTKRLDSFIHIVEAGNAAIKLYVETEVDSKKAKELTAFHLSKKEIDGIFCMSDEILTGAMRAVLESGKKYPDDIGIIAISHGFFPTLYFPEITYVETSGSKLGQLAFAQMMAFINDKKQPEEIYVESKLVEGGSV